ncbi:hypothetical protein BO86DRAFT_403601 [Aspergillus japonicus CBS 114.51]|uniref:Uncharacterized protein n=2 Tax=Aspergillus TaxID=5052 RepID=A0A2V5HJ77_ASPV1|nr:hypothetical protein BO86DRAFT_403601 [Aspergillus japonicus CBS 114.51]PYI22632.1 hypothetical protein BO99DRAFT_399764 [Aspergillus violaceofuscus CBS 115571]RAH77601.1 hypothetical protein BO86DRAFT_403601 [Aspergillus japonicus CBS 114.51]
MRLPTLHILPLLPLTLITLTTATPHLQPRDTTPFTTGLTTITAAATTLDVQILTYPGGDDISNITAGAATLINAFLAETKTIQPDFLNATEAAALLPPLETLAAQISVVVADYIGIHAAIAATAASSDGGWYIYSQLQEEHTAALSYTGSVVARIPAGEVKDAAAVWAGNITDTLLDGRDAYKDIAVRPTGY